MIQHNLFTSNFKLYLKRLAGIAGACILFMLVCRILNFLYFEDDERARIMWHNFYGQEENIDYICVGSSHVYNAVNPELLDAESGENYYNMSTGGQKLRESYYIIKAANRRNQLKGVYLDLYFLLSIEGWGNYDEFDVISGGWKNLDYSKFSVDKAAYFFDSNPPAYYISAALPFTRYREHLCDVEWIYGMQKSKKRVEYQNYQYCWETEDSKGEYTEEGYFYHSLELVNPYFYAESIPADMGMTEDAEKYLKKIIEYCQKEGIPITLFQTPVYELEAAAYEKYDDYTADVREIAEEYHAAYYDFNLIKEEYLPIQNMKNFVDTGHLNGNGAEMFTNCFYEVITGTSEENEKMFYKSFQEKLASEEAGVIGVYYRPGSVEELERGEVTDNMYIAAIASNRESGLKYQIYLTPDGGETKMVQDFSENRRFYIPVEEHGLCRIVWYEESDAENHEAMEIKY